MLKLGFSENTITKIEKNISAKVRRSVDLAQKATLAGINEMHKDIFYEK